jgi:hypothetical protein
MLKIQQLFILATAAVFLMACHPGPGPIVGTVDAGPEAMQLAQAYSPVLYLAKQTGCDDTIDTDVYDPAAVDVFLDKLDVRLMTNRSFPRSDAMTMTQPRATDLYDAGKKKYLDDLEKSHPRNADDRCNYEAAYATDKGTRPTVYARVAHHDASTAVQYWFFYYFDDWINRHEGDWELVQLIFPSGSSSDILGQAIHPEVMDFSEHTGGRRLDWSDVETAQVAGASHPVVYVGAGSHANYPKAGYWHADVKYWFDGCDLAAEGAAARRLDSTDYDLPLMSDPATRNDEFAWAKFAGNWGELSIFGFSGPNGPLFQTQGRDPWKWHRGLKEGVNERCVQREGGQRSASAGSRVLQGLGSFSEPASILAGDVALFFMTWGGSDASLTLKSPSGDTIDAKTKLANVTHERGDHKKGETYEVYRIAGAERGTWTMIVNYKDFTDPETVTWESYDLPPTCDDAKANTSEDTDLDGIANDQEEALKLDPCSWDSDDNGSRDTAEPPQEVSNPGDAFSPSHKIGERSNDPVVVIQWSRLASARAFSVDWTQSAVDVPDAEPDLPGDATEARSLELSDGEWYFHLRTQGENGDWTNALHLGPFVIDQLADCPPLQDLVLSTSEPNRDGVVTVSWESSGGCEPYRGTLTATYGGDQEPYARYDVKEASGRQEDRPPVRCEGPYEVVYSLTLEDGAGRQTDATAATRVESLC